MEQRFAHAILDVSNISQLMYETAMAIIGAMAGR